MGSREESIVREGGRDGRRKEGLEGGRKRESRIIAYLLLESEYTCREGTGYIKK